MTRRALALVALLSCSALAGETGEKPRTSADLKAWTLDDAPSRPKDPSLVPAAPTRENCRGKKRCPKGCYRSYETCSAEAGCRNRHFCAERGYDPWAGKKPAGLLCGEGSGCPRPPCYRGPSSCAWATNMCSRDIVCREPDFDPGAKSWAKPASGLNLISR